MGAALWAASALSAFFVARIVPTARRKNYLTELVTAVTVAMLCGLIATALDFGGWRELEWRASLLALFGSLSAIACLRAIRLLRA